MTRHYLIAGRVQGVGFRWFARREARKLGLVGWVRNLADGDVEAVAHGSEEKLAKFEGSIRRGPAAARVERVTIDDVEETQTLEDFVIRR